MNSKVQAWPSTREAVAVFENETELLDVIEEL